MQISIMQKLILIRVLTFRKPGFLCFTKMDNYRILTTFSDFILLAIMHVRNKRIPKPPFLKIICIISIYNTAVQYFV